MHKRHMEFDNRRLKLKRMGFEVIWEWIHGLW